LKKWLLSLIGGLIFLAYSVASIMHSLGVKILVIDFIFNPTTTKILLIVAALLLIYDSLSLYKGLKRLFSIIVAAILFILSVLPVLVYRGLLDFLPFSIELIVKPFVLEAVLIAYSIYLLFNAAKLVKFNL